MLSINMVNMAITRHAVAWLGNGVSDGRDECSDGEDRPTLVSCFFSMSRMYTTIDETTEAIPAPMSQLVEGIGKSAAADAAATSRVMAKCGGLVLKNFRADSNFSCDSNGGRGFDPSS